MTSTAPFSRVAALPFLALLALAPAAAAHDAREQLAALLRAPAAEERPMALLVEDLLALQPAPVVELFEAFHRGRVPAAAGAEPAPGPRETAALRVVLAHADHELVQRRFEALAALEQDVERRTSALIALADSATRHDLGLLGRLAASPLDPHASPRALREPFERALAALLARTPGPWSGLAELYRDGPAGLRLPIARALSGTPGDQALRALAGLLRHAPDAHALVLREIERACAEREPVTDELVLAPVRVLLASQSPDVLRGAAPAAGALGDERAIPALVELLSHDQAGVRNAAHEALRALTQLRLGPDAAAWQAWRADEERWWSERWPTLAAELAGDGGGPSAATRRAAAALNDLARIRTRRAELAALAQTCLTHAEPDVARVACAALAELGEPCALPALAETLGHARAEVRDAAWTALKRISGLDLAPDRRTWLAAIDPR